MMEKKKKGRDGKGERTDLHGKVELVRGSETEDGTTVAGHAGKVLDDQAAEEFLAAAHCCVCWLSLWRVLLVLLVRPSVLFVFCFSDEANKAN